MQRNSTGFSFTKQLSKNLGLNSSLSEKFILIPYNKIWSLNLRYFMKLAPELQGYVNEFKDLNKNIVFDLQ